MKMVDVLRALVLYATTLTASSGPSNTASKSSLMRRELELDKQVELELDKQVAKASSFLQITDVEVHGQGHVEGTTREVAGAVHGEIRSLPHVRDEGDLTNSHSSSETSSHNESFTKEALASSDHTKTETKTDQFLQKLHPLPETAHPAPVSNLSDDLRLLQAEAANASALLDTATAAKENNEVGSAGLMRKELPTKSHAYLDEKPFAHGALLRKEGSIPTVITNTTHALANSAGLGLLRAEPRGPRRGKTAVEVNSNAELEEDDSADPAAGYTTKVQKMLSKRTGQSPDDGTFTLGVVHVILILCIAVTAVIGLPWLTGGVAEKPSQAMLIAYGGVEKGEILNDVYAEAQRKRVQALAASLSRSAVGVVV